MNDAERKASMLRQQAYSVLSGREPSDEVVRHLHRLERNTPELFGAVVEQLENDNGRWSSASGMPFVEIVRDREGRVDAIIFSEHETELQPADQDVEAFLWVSDRIDIKWFEAFAEELLRNDLRRAHALINKPPFPPHFKKNGKAS